MTNNRKKKQLISLCLLLCTIFLFSIRSMAENEMKVIETIQEELESITVEEKEILEHLFIQTQEIERLEREEKEIEQEIMIKIQDVNSLQDQIKVQEITYEKNKEVLKQVLQTYQRMGPGSHIEIILESDSLSDLLRRINTLRDLTKNTGDLLDGLESSHKNLQSEKDQLDEKLKTMEAKQQELKESISDKAQLIKEKEAYLATLAGDRESFLEKLHHVQKMKDEARQALRHISKEFEVLIEEANFPPDAFVPTFGFLSVKGSIKEEVFNDILEEHKAFPEIKITFKPEVAEIEIPSQKLFFKGHFNIVQGSSLQYEITSGTFHGMKLESNSLEYLFSEGDLVLHLAPLLEKNTIKSIEIKDGAIELTVSLKFF